MPVTAEEKIRQLLDSEKSKRAEIEEKKKELEKKKKEVEELEKARRQEIAAAQEEIESQLEELFTEEQKSYAEEEKKKRSQENLEEKVGPEKAAALPEFKGYGDAIERVMRGNADFYSLTNYNVVNKLEALAEEARNRSLTKEEQSFVSTIETHARELVKNDFYKNDPGQEYLREELLKIDLINQSAKKTTEYKVDVR